MPVSPSTIVSVCPVVRVHTTARPIDIASRIVVIPAWKSVSCERHDDEGGVGVQLAQVEEVEAARPSTLAGRRVPAELSARFDHGLAAAMTTSTSRPADRLDERRVVAQLLADGADHGAVPCSAARRASGRQNAGVDHERR